MCDVVARFNTLRSKTQAMQLAVIIFNSSAFKLSNNKYSPSCFKGFVYLFKSELRSCVFCTEGAMQPCGAAASPVLRRME